VVFTFSIFLASHVEYPQYLMKFKLVTDFPPLASVSKSPMI